MKYYLAVFKTRFATLNFANLLRANNIPVSIINTPQKISFACGISIKFLGDFLPQVAALLRGYRSNSFDGLYEVINRQGRADFIRL